MNTTEERMQILEKQFRRQRRWNIALGDLVLVGGTRNPGWVLEMVPTSPAAEVILEP